MNKMSSGLSEGATPSQMIDERIEQLGDWRGETLSNVRRILLGADPEMVEEWKWNVPVWSHAGLVCTGETYKDKVKFTFAKGASLVDPTRMFNSSLDGNARRALDLFEGDKVDENALASLIREAVALNVSKAKPGKK